jgi:hypothetical protein
LLIRRHGDPAWRKPDVSAYPTEEVLESLLAGSPELLPGLEATPVVMARQVQTGAGPVDLLGVGLDGSIVVIEYKLRANPEIRRAVIGQLLAYASSIWQTSAATFEQAVGARLAQPLVAAARALAADDAWDETTFRANLERNLATARDKPSRRADVPRRRLPGCRTHPNRRAFPWSRSTQLRTNSSAPSNT